MRVPSFWTRVMPPGSMAVTLPLGPSTRTVLPLTVYLTPAGSGIGFLPIRDMMNPFVACELRAAFAGRSTAAGKLFFVRYPCRTTKTRMRQLPNFAENLAADTFAAGLTAGHDSLGGGHDGDAKATLDAADLIAPEVNTAAGTRDTLQIADDGFVVRAVLEIDAQDPLPILFGGLVVRDVTLFLEDAGDLGLELGCGDVELLVTGTDGVADAGQEVGYWISEVHSFSFIPRSLGRVLYAQEPAGMFVSGGTSRLLHHKLAP